MSFLTLRWNLSPQKSCHATATGAVRKALCGAVEHERLVLVLRMDDGVGAGVVVVVRAALVVVGVVVGAGVVLVVKAALVVDDDVGAGVVVVEVPNDAVVSMNTKLVALLALTDTFVPLTKTGAGVVVVV